jgi:hypothetical protein
LCDRMVYKLRIVALVGDPEFEAGMPWGNRLGSADEKDMVAGGYREEPFGSKMQDNIVAIEDMLILAVEMWNWSWRIHKVCSHHAGWDDEARGRPTVSQMGVSQYRV